MKLYQFTERSENKKTGPIPVTMSAPLTCPDSCPIKGAGCYAEQWPLGAVWRQVGKTPTHARAPKSIDLAQLTAKIRALPEGQLWRHNQAGDLPGANEALDLEAFRAIVEANRGKAGFTYTHKKRTEYLDEYRRANEKGFAVNLSADSIKEADSLAESGLPVVLTVASDAKPHKTPKGRQVAICPAQLKKGLTCLDCKLCAASNRKSIIGFRAHGGGAKKLNARLKGENK